MLPDCGRCPRSFTRRIAPSHVRVAALGWTRFPHGTFPTLDLLDRRGGVDPDTPQVAPRHSLRRATVTLSSRARVSSGSPRSRRVTAASLRRAEKRRSGPAPPEGAPASAVWAHAGAPSGLSLRI